MRLLLDTSVLIWWLADDRKPPKNARALIAGADNDVIVSSASLWEISIKATLNLLEIELDDPEDDIAQNGFRALSIAFRHALIAGRLPPGHRDHSTEWSLRQCRRTSSHLA